MKAETFKNIIEALDRGESPSLYIKAGEKEYIRRFVRGDRLILLGGGHVSLDVYHMARLLDFDVTVVDDRPEFANTARFPEAEVICDSFVAAIQRLAVRDTDYVCVLTRGHRWDKECVEAILSGVMPYYLGMIGSRSRSDGLRQSLLEKGHDKGRIAQLHAPIGLKIGSQTTAEIALSICAEMISEKRRIKHLPADNELTQTNVNQDMLRFLACSDVPRAVLVVLASSGSTPVKSGSMMAVDRLGKGCGTIGGGCSEAAAITKARRIIATGGSAVIDIDMTNDAAAENGMVCGGEMTVLIETVG